MLNIFFPIRLNNNFILKRKIIIIYITQNNFSAVLINVFGKTREILKYIFFEFENKENTVNEIFLSSLISKSIINWDYDYIKLILSSNNIIFKSVSSPFSDIEKTKMTIPFELESLLPFQLIEASVDVIYQSKQQNNDKNKVLAVITKEEYLNSYREIFKKLNLLLYSITVDVVELIQYDLYYYDQKSLLHMVIYNNGSNFVILLYSDKELLIVKCIDSLTSFNVKSLPEDNKENEADLYMITQTLNSISEDMKININGIMLNVIGLEVTHPIIEKLITQYEFKLDSYSVKNNETVIIKEKDDQIVIKNPFIYIASSVFHENDLFNLGHKEDTQLKNKILFKQTIFALSASFFIYIIIFMYNIFDVYQVNKSISIAENQLIMVLKKEFKLPAKSLYNIDIALNESKKIVEDMEQNLPIIVTHDKFLFITLFSNIVKSLSHDIKELQVNEIRWKLGIDAPSNLNILGSVADFDSLHIFEENLRQSNLFLLVPQQQDLHFNFNLTIAS
jgi:hypothetical protein